jgi:hypothetical protein
VLDRRERVEFVSQSKVVSLVGGMLVGWLIIIHPSSCLLALVQKDSF